ncbi:tRNA (adenosine(37)-N6)-threonylcarbamoyltransferase complex transferase subunit TsaD [Marinigracilibium pacificum]|uniref:tRNA N6-adenosine threonylcarbamoyltransferase n=1 Tax=Marinigracilibium pacificum TaxID=2729599 RepID=A0A848J487_9BACT|nr:tRNA (adenosine(37)-N6)-threonylcarbamoyltransferase complex transferase subunit TsaD [Marinigracilibium pacificum]NMM50536.1 tRNA (adenosine(37)-N6)-threonylcarbamoyltransferase complex transferase subunit TsaD [Marinigracilibium pacificum]
MSINILAIESSCDETAASVISDGKVVNNIIATQDIHEKYGGVVPELASRVHQQNIVPVVSEALKQANIEISDINAVAFTRGPGLLGSLLVGVSFAKGLSLARNIPMIEVNHMQAHILAHFIDDPKPEFPFLCLTVSGGHTQLVVVRDYLDMEIIGQTKDDAVGEAFDKAAKIMGLPYPGGPLIDKYAKDGDPKKYTYPPAEIPGLDFSFSGIKTAILYFLRDELKSNPDFIKENINDICAGIQQSLINMLIDKLKKAVKQTGIKRVALAGGVSANSGLRNTLQSEAEKHGWETFIPAFEYCTDNAGMIAIAAWYKYQAKEFVDLNVSAEPRLKF